MSAIPPKPITPILSFANFTTLSFLKKNLPPLFHAINEILLYIEEFNYEGSNTNNLNRAS
ncbi:hypothetical protein BJP48_09350 [Paenibacillus odorifer]|nr:hypothetical protein BJP47_25040 [Paenibacillus odorifer]OMD21042.1 hypothetical protein BJP48_09350 [Paenibacillus odorifer]